MVLALNLVPFAGIAFLWFIGVVRDRLGTYEDRFFATVFFGSGFYSSPCSLRRQPWQGQRSWFLTPRPN